MTKQGRRSRVTAAGGLGAGLAALVLWLRRSPWFWIVLMSALMIASLGWMAMRLLDRSRHGARRVSSLQALARTLGLRFRGDAAPGGLLARLQADFPLLRHADARALNVLEGRTPRGRHVHAFDYADRGGLGEQSFVVVEHSADLGSVTATPHTDPNRLPDVLFDSEEFNRRYFVEADDPARAYDIWTPPLIEYVLGLEPLAIHTAGRRALFWRPAGRLAVEELARTIRDGLGFVDRLAHAPEAR